MLGIEIGSGSCIEKSEHGRAQQPPNSLIRKRYSKEPAIITFILTDAGEPGTSDTSSYIITLKKSGIIVLNTGDTNANGAVNAGDVAQTKSRIGQPIDATNFRSDVNANGSLNASDASVVKSKTGTALPP